jgi:hypothetical protein
VGGWVGGWPRCVLTGREWGGALHPWEGYVPHPGKGNNALENINPNGADVRSYIFQSIVV